MVRALRGGDAVPGTIAHMVGSCREAADQGGDTGAALTGSRRQENGLSRHSEACAPPVMARLAAVQEPTVCRASTRYSGTPISSPFIGVGRNICWQFIRRMRNEKGYEKIGVVGYCYGGTLAILLGASPTSLVNSIVVAHPGSADLNAINAINVRHVRAISASRL
jgi:hypothetical protein